MQEITLEKARELGYAVETVRVAGVANATGYVSKRMGTESIELGTRVATYWPREIPVVA